MRGESHVTYDEAQNTCADSGMYIHFSKNSDQFDEFISEDVSRTEWYGKFQLLIFLKILLYF
jgi:hypothetical protein